MDVFGHNPSDTRSPFSLHKARHHIAQIRVRNYECTGDENLLGSVRAMNIRFKLLVWPIANKKLDPNTILIPIT